MRTISYAIISGAIILAVFVIFFQENAIPTEHAETFVLSSSAFKNNGTIPSLYTCDGTAISPPLAISHIPQAAKSLALTVVDVDAPRPLYIVCTRYNA